MNLQRLRDVLQRYLCRIGKRHADLALHLGQDLCRDCNAPWLRDPLKPRRDIHAVAVEVTPLHDHVAQIDANAQHDSAVLGQILSRSRFEEVWLFSGGGNLDEGIKVGRLLRRHSATVRVPNVARVRSIIAWPKPTMQVFCVSSCTVAFMGGLFRYVDPDATYQVHSASSVTQLSKELSTFLDDNGFAGFAASKERSTRLNGIRLFRHFQNTLVMPLVRPGGIQPFAENDQSFLDWAKRFRSRYSAAQFEVDRQRYESEGRASLQDILMRIERDSMMGVIEDIRADLNSYGSRAKHALAMLEVMYKVGIKDTFILDRETMYAMGYLTKDLPTAP